MKKNDAYPLTWPFGWNKTLLKNRKRARFNTSFAKARDGLLSELRLMGAREIIISTNIPLRRDGLPYASGREPEDTAVAVYFSYDGNSQCIPCDKWDRVQDNMQAVNLTICAIRGLERWGAKEMVDAAFRGFVALPPPEPKSHWHEVLEVSLDASPEEIRRAFLKKVKETHPDTGGNINEFREVRNAYEKALKLHGKD